jgi:hypothetical protein
MRITDLGCSYITHKRRIPLIRVKEWPAPGQYCVNGFTGEYATGDKRVVECTYIHRGVVYVEKRRGPSWVVATGRDVLLPR